MKPTSLPGIEKDPDLKRRMDRELTRAGCRDCDRTAILQKYAAILKNRRVGNAPLNPPALGS